MPASGDVARGFAPVTVGQDIAQLDAQFPRALRFGTACASVVLLDIKGGLTTFTNVQQSEVIEGAVRQVVSATGTPTDIVAYY